VTEFANYKAPRANEEVFCEPPVDTWDRLASASPNAASINKVNFNRASFNREVLVSSTKEIRWSGILLQEIRTWTRRDAIRYSHCNTNSCSDLQSDLSDDLKLWYVSGHQPEFFHPGVWFKNFILYEAAKQQNAVALNVVIDHDAASPVSIAVPSRNVDGSIVSKVVVLEGWPLIETSVTTPSANVPWELTLDNGKLDWLKFENDVSELVKPIGIDRPLIQKMVPMIRESIALGAPIGKAIALARHQIERDCGVKNHEVLFSQLAQGRGFSAFVFEILASLESFREIYHSSRRDYRSHHHIKNETQPIPPLAEKSKDGFVWMEAPFWVYRKEAPARRPLWIRYANHKIILSDLNQWESQIERNSDFVTITAWWQDLIRDQVAIRPRALTSTLFMRLAISDLFLHGIGGGKYDQITDLIIERWCGIEPSAFAVATATLFLPIEIDANESAENVSPRNASTSEARDRLRDYRFNPERLVPVASSVETHGLCNQLRERISDIPTGSEKIRWHEALQTLKSQIRSALAKEALLDQLSLASQLQASIEEDHQQKLRTSREYSIAVFPDDWTQEKLFDLTQANIGARQEHRTGPLASIAKAGVAFERD